jgi:hypothetical protein
LLWPLSDDVSVDEVFGFGLSLDIAVQKKTLAAKKASTSLPLPVRNFPAKYPLAPAWRDASHRRSSLIQINLDRLWLPKDRAVQRRVAGKSLGTQHPALEEWFKWPLKRRPLRTIRGTASLR